MKVIWFVVLVVFAEAFCRLILGLGSPPLSIEHPKIEYMFKPSQNLYRFHNNIIINKYGMRSNDFAVNKIDQNESRILILGDSVVNGGSLISHEMLATTILQNRLKNTIVANISAGSWGPENQLNYIKEFGFFDADVFILVISGHDLFDVPTYKPLNPLTHPKKNPSSAFYELITRYVPRYLPTFLVKKTEVEVEAKPVKKTNSVLLEMLKLAKSKVKKVAVVYHMSKVEMSSEAGKEFYEIESLCKELKIPLINTKSKYEKKDIHKDDIHLSKLGQKVLGKIFIDLLMKD